MQADHFNGHRKEMEYDSSNRIKEVTDPGTGNMIGQYFYDDQGFRVRKVASDETDGVAHQTELLYPSMYFGIERKRTVKGKPVSGTSYSVNNIYLNGVRIAAVVPDGGTRYFLTDQVDSVNLVVGESGETLTRFEYMPYGEAWFIQKAEGLEEDFLPKFNSQELDEETGFYFYNARHYDARIGRFVTAGTVIDGEADTQGWNRYAYVKGNPVSYRDPTGHLGNPIASFLQKIFG